MSIEKALKNTGGFLIGAGVIGGIIGLFMVDFESYNRAKEVYEELFTNEFAEASYQAARTIMIAEISALVTWIIGFAVGGLLLMGVAKIIELQQETVEYTKKQERAQRDLQNELRSVK